MAYIGKSPDGTGVRSRFYYTQTSGGGTSVSGSSDDGTSLAFSDGAYVDVFLNGVLLVAGTDYNTSTANTIAGLAALANGDVVEVVVYDIFTVADTVSALNGGTFSNSVTIDKDGGTALTVDRATSNGNVAEFQKNGTTLAQIGALGVRGYFAADNAGISPYQNVIYPTNGTGTAVDNTVDIGHSSYRFKDLYLGGGIYLGGTGSANQISDYETGTWTATLGGTSSNPTVSSYAYNSGHYTKIGRQVFAHIYIRIEAGQISGGSGDATILGLPFASKSGGSISNGAGAWIENYTYTSTSFSSNRSYARPVMVAGESRMRIYQLSYSDPQQVTGWGLTQADDAALMFGGVMVYMTD
jgi:hypothetical protein